MPGQVRGVTHLGPWRTQTMHSSYHPSTTPGAIIGYRKNGTPIRLAAGGDETHEGGNTGADQEGPGHQHRPVLATARTAIRAAWRPAERRDRRRTSRRTAGDDDKHARH